MSPAQSFLSRVQMVRTEEVSKKKKSASSDGSKPQRDVEKNAKGSAADKKKQDPSSSKSAGQKARETAKDKPLHKGTDGKPKSAPKQPAGRGSSQAKQSDDYLGDMDLPTSSDDEELEGNGHATLYAGEQQDKDRELVTKVDASRVSNLSWVHLRSAVHARCAIFAAICWPTTCAVCHICHPYS